MTSELKATLAISKSEALNGTSRILTLPGGRKVTVAVPPGAYNGQMIRVGGQDYEDTLLLTLSIIQAETTTGDSNQELPTIAASNPYAQNPYTAPSSSYQNPATATPNLYTQNPPSAPTPSNTQPSTPTVAVSNANPQQTVSSPFYAQQESDIAPPPPPPPSQTAPILPPTTGGIVTTRPSFATGRTLLLVGLALLLIAGGVVGLFYVIHANQITTTNANATATANTAATVTANAFNVTATAQATSIAATADAFNATATAQAQVAATASVVAANPDPYAGGTLALYDPLNNKSTSSWGEFNDNQGGNCKFTGGAYHVSELNTSKGTSNECFSSLDFSNFAFEVQAQILQGDSAGLTFRYNNTTSTSYIFYVGQDGSYELLICTGTNCHDLVTTSTSSAIHQGIGQTNLIAVVAQGSTITVYVNHQQLASVNDSTYSHGQLGLAASPFTTGGHPTEVAYTNAKVWKL